MRSSRGISLNSPQSPPAGRLELRVLDPVADPEWERLVTAHPDAGIFHGSAWARVLGDTYGHRPVYLHCHREGRPAVLVPLMEVRSFLTGRRGVCVPFADFCEPLVYEGCDRAEVTKAMGDIARERGWRHFEIRGGPAPHPGATASLSFYAHTLDLTAGPDVLLSAMDGSTRRALRKAGRSAVRTEIRTDQEAVAAYFALHTQTRRRHGLPPQPQTFFFNIWKHIISAGLGSVVLAFADSTPVAGAVFFQSRTRAVYKFGASDERAQGARVNNLVMWAGIRSLCDQGAKVLHFGRSSPDQDGLRRFKRGWGAVESLLPYFRFDCRKDSWVSSTDRVAGAHNAIFSRLPLGLNRMAGRMIYPHLD